MSAELIPWYDRIRRNEASPPATYGELRTVLEKMLMTSEWVLASKLAQGYTLACLSGFSAGYNEDEGYIEVRIDALLRKT